MVDFLNRVNWVDLFALILFIRIGYISAHIGVGKQILPFILSIFVLVAPLYIYSGISIFFAEKFSLSVSLCDFVSYTLLTVCCLILFHVISRLTGFYLPDAMVQSSTIERAGGAFLGVLRSFIAAGIAMIILVLMPIQFAENGVKDSYSGPFFIKTDLKFYNVIMDAVFKTDEISHRKTATQFLNAKKDFYFGSIDVKNKSKFFKNEYN